MQEPGESFPKAERESVQSQAADQDASGTMGSIWWPALGLVLVVTSYMDGILMRGRGGTLTAWYTRAFMHAWNLETWGGATPIRR